MSYTIRSLYEAVHEEWEKRNCQVWKPKYMTNSHMETVEGTVPVEERFSMKTGGMTWLIGKPKKEREIIFSFIGRDPYRMIFALSATGLLDDIEDTGEMIFADMEDELLERYEEYSQGKAAIIQRRINSDDVEGLEYAVLCLTDVCDWLGNYCDLIFDPMERIPTYTDEEVEMLEVEEQEAMANEEIKALDTGHPLT